MKIFIVTVGEYEGKYNYFVTDKFADAIDCAWEQIHTTHRGEEFSTIEYWNDGKSIYEFGLWIKDTIGNTKEEFWNNVATAFYNAEPKEI